MSSNSVSTTAVTSTSQIPEGFDRSWFELNAQHNAVDQQKFLKGIEIITNPSQLVRTQYPIVEYVFEQLKSTDISTWQPAERVNQVVQNFFNAWPKVTIGTETAYLPKTALEKISPKFKSALNLSMRESVNNCVVLNAPGNLKVARLALNYLKTEEITIDSENVLDVLGFSNEHMIEPLIKKCGEYIQQNLSWDTFSEVLDLAPQEALPPSLLCACLSFAQKNRNTEVYQSLSTEKQSLVTLSNELCEHHVFLFLSPEGKPAINLGRQFNVGESASIELVGKINQLIGVNYLDIDVKDITLEALEQIKLKVPNLEELTLRSKNLTTDHLPILKEMFSKLRSFGNRARSLGTVAEVKEYLKQFAAPCQENGSSESASVPLRLRSLSLDLSFVKGITQEDIDNLSQYFNELYYLFISMKKVSKLSLINAIECSCFDCPALTTLSTPSATWIFTSFCQALTTIEAPNATCINCLGCTSLTTIEAPLYSTPLFIKITQLIASYERKPEGKYKISMIRHEQFSPENIQISTDNDEPLPILNDIPYFNALILDAVVLKGESLLQSRNYEGAIYEAGYVLGIDPNHEGAKRLMEAAQQAKLTYPPQAS